MLKPQRYIFNRIIFFFYHRTFKGLIYMPVHVLVELRYEFFVNFFYRKFVL